MMSDFMGFIEKLSDENIGKCRNYKKQSRSVIVFQVIHIGTIFASIQNLYGLRATLYTTETREGLNVIHK